ncbi:voltage-dependent anion channel [Mycena filopes]|nr:voltage-dependent anion channel [Mycena filopes]
MAPRQRTQTFASLEAALLETESQATAVRLLDRLEHFTWTQPHTFPGLETIGKMVYIWDLFVFTAAILCITYRFLRFPGTFVGSLTHPTESLFAATPLVGLASLIAAIARYGIPSAGSWLVVTYRALFWFYFIASFAAAVGIYFLLFTSPALKLSDMTPAWDLPIFPVMLSGTIAAAGAALQPPAQGVPMIVAGLTAQALGMMISVLMYSNYIHRMIQYGFPSPESRAGMFVAVGPPSFTSLALIGLANDFPVGYHTYFGDGEATVQIIKVLAAATAVFLWSLSLWFFCISTLACLAAWYHGQMRKFRLNWWAFVFSNAAFTLATISIGRSFQSAAMGWAGSVMSVLLVVLYLALGVRHVRAFVRRDILWEGKDEDTYWTERDHKGEKLREKAENGENVGAR